MKRDRLTATERETILRCARAGYSDWEIFAATGHARSTICYIRGKAMIPAVTGRDGRRRRQIPRHILSPEPDIHPAVALYRAERARRSA